EKTLKDKKVISIQGSVKKELRGAIIDQFQKDPDTMVIVGQIDTLGVGVTLTAADTCVYYSKTYNYATYEQSLSRIHRIGQRNVCTYIDLMVDNSVDERITKALRKKEDLATKIVDNWREIFN
ncbi:MAG: SWF/SNF helicase family protein, partial [Lachnospiraceae bacterium]|nr:SWF/SNF helicase family protein [Lachnospiraceae bacterium]